MTRITRVSVEDLRFPTSKTLDGSDAVNTDPDYSAAYVVLHTDQDSLEGHGLTFTIGRGNELCVAAIQALSHLVVGRTIAELTADMSAFYKELTCDSQLRWVGPEKGVLHLATAAVINAVWDLWAKSEGKPLWRLVADLSPQQLVQCIDFRYITDALTPDDALARLEEQAGTKAERIRTIHEVGYPAYTTSAGWLGYSDEKLRRLCREALARGWTHLKLKVGRDLEDDIRRCRIVREEIGDQMTLMVDANQIWEIDQAIDWMRELAFCKPYWIEEPTSPDDVLGHARIRQALNPIKIATGEQCQNRILFKQFMQAQAMDICQIDSCRLGGVNEVLSVLLLADKFGIPVCPHAGGVGLCQYTQHLAIIDYVCISGSLTGRVLEHVDHLHEHFYDSLDVREGRYFPPSQPGYSITMKPESRETYRYPTGPAWTEQRKEEALSV